MFKKIAAVVTGLFASVKAFAAATPTDFTPLTSGLDYSTVVTGLLAVAGAVAVVYIAWSGAKKILAALRSA